MCADNMQKKDAKEEDTQSERRQGCSGIPEQLARYVEALLGWPRHADRSSNHGAIWSKEVARGYEFVIIEVPSCPGMSKHKQSRHVGPQALLAGCSVCEMHVGL